jgi:GNAT superfamily N-acetyltransferase
MSTAMPARGSAAGGDERPAAGHRPTLQPVRSRTQLDTFVRCAWPIYSNDPHWVPPLIGDMKAALNRDRHPFHQHADVELFTAHRDGRVAGRIAAIVNRNHNQFHDDRVGFFGLFESVDDPDVATALLSGAEAWLKERGMDTCRGPMNLSTNDELWGPGILIDGFDSPPAIMMGHNPPYYRALFEGAGYDRSRDLLTYWIDTSRQTRIERSADRLLRRGGFTIRSLDMRKLNEEVATIQAIYNSAWERNWGFVPMTEEEILHLAAALRPVVNPDLCALAFVGDEPVGFALALPDYNQALRHINGRLFPFGLLKLLWFRRKIDAARTLTLGVKPEHRGSGLDALLILHLFRMASVAGMPRGECSWILEDNMPMRHALERFGAVLRKTYRVYEKPLP